MIKKNVANIIKTAGIVVNTIAPLAKIRYHLISLGYNISKFDNNHLYEVGELVDVDNIIAVVVKSKEEGRHGKLMCLKTARKEWGYKHYANQNTNGRDSSYPLTHYDISIKNPSDIDGELNCKSIENEIAKWNSDDLHQHTALLGNEIINVEDRIEFPAFNYCKEIGKDWYLPANEELSAVFANAKILTLVQQCQKFYHSIQKFQIWSSTYDKAKHDYDNYFGDTSYAYGICLCADGIISIESFPQSTKALVYPFRKF